MVEGYACQKYYYNGYFWEKGLSAELFIILCAVGVFVFVHCHRADLFIYLFQNLPNCYFLK